MREPCRCRSPAGRRRGLIGGDDTTVDVDRLGRRVSDRDRSERVHRTARDETNPSNTYRARRCARSGTSYREGTRARVRVPGRGTEKDDEVRQFDRTEVDQGESLELRRGRCRELPGVNGPRGVKHQGIDHGFGHDEDRAAGRNVGVDPLGGRGVGVARRPGQFLRHTIR